jgi:hypothetical protein
MWSYPQVQGPQVQLIRFHPICSHSHASGCQSQLIRCHYTFSHEDVNTSVPRTLFFSGYRTVGAVYKPGDSQYSCKWRLPAVLIQELWSSNFRISQNLVVGKQRLIGF